MSEPVGPADPADDLYALDPDQFTAARNDLAKTLRASGRRDEVTALAGLRRPPATAWALNAVARQEPALVEAVLAAGTDLRAAMERALAGDPTGVREAQVKERRAIDEASAAGASHLGTSGRPTGVGARRRMAATLRAAVGDPAVADLLRRGVLDADRDAPGFVTEGLTAPAGAVTAGLRSDTRRAAGGRHPTEREQAGHAPTPDHDAGGDGRTAAAKERADAAPRAGRLEAEADEAEAGSRQAERVAAEAQRHAAERRSAATAAAEEAELAAARSRRLQDEADDAEQQATAARVAADDAARQVADARRRAGRDG